MQIFLYVNIFPCFCSFGIIYGGNSLETIEEKMYWKEILFLFQQLLWFNVRNEAPKGKSFSSSLKEKLLRWRTIAIAVAICNVAGKLINRYNIAGAPSRGCGGNFLEKHQDSALIKFRVLVGNFAEIIITFGIIKLRARASLLIDSRLMNSGVV